MRDRGCYICQPDNPDASPEGCDACDREWQGGVLLRERVAEARGVERGRAEVWEELALLRALWDFVWNQLGTTDGGDHAELTWDENGRLSDLAEAVEAYDIRRAALTEERP